jgi:hypothetical protein
MFAGASGLCCNMSKCQMASSLAASLFPCQFIDFPVNYLGIPLSFKKLLKSAVRPLLDKMYDKLPAWKGRLMNQSGRLTLIKTTLCAIPLYTAFNIKLPSWLLKAMHKLIKGFLWSGMEVVQQGKCLVSWDKVQRPLELGGLGFLDLEWMGRALRSHWLLQQFDGQQGISGSFSCSTDSTTLSFFRASTRPLLGDGYTFKFWSSPWLQGRSIEKVTPDLFAAVARRDHRSRTVAVVLTNHAWRRDITGPLTIPVLVQVLELHHRLQDFVL